MTCYEVKYKADKFVREWQEILRLQDWTVSVRVPAKALKTVAHCEYREWHKRASITICHPRYKEKSGMVNWDLETTVVHELLHIKFPFLCYSDTHRHFNAFESGIEQMAQSMVALKRGKHSTCTVCSLLPRKAA